MNKLSKILLRTASVLLIFLLPQAWHSPVTDLLFLKDVASLASPQCRPIPTSLALLSGALRMTGVGLYVGCSRGTRGRSPALSGDDEATEACVSQTLLFYLKNCMNFW